MLLELLWPQDKVKPRERQILRSGYLNLKLLTSISRHNNVSAVYVCALASRFAVTACGKFIYLMRIIPAVGAALFSAHRTRAG